MAGSLLLQGATLGRSKLRNVRERARQQGVELVVHAPEASVRALVDRGQLSTVFVNLFLKQPGWRAAEGFGQPAVGYPD